LLRWLLCFCLSTFTLGRAAAAAATPDIESTYSEHARGVAMARAGRYDEALAILRPLHDRFPTDYPLSRDVILINTWKGDCAEALALFWPLRDRPQLDDYLIEPLAQCAVERARIGDRAVAIDALSALLPHSRDEFPLRRDLALISAWDNDCRAALDWFDPIRDDSRLPVYVIVPMHDCMLHERRLTEALALADAGLAYYPEDSTLRDARVRAQAALQLASQDETRPVLRAGVMAANSDRGVREWVAHIDTSVQVAEQTRLYARLLRSHINDAAFDVGQMRRVGAGVRWQPSARWQVDQRISLDRARSDANGSHTLIEYRPYETWHVAVAYDSFAEDISVRARASGIEANHLQTAADYHNGDYVWHWRGSAGRYDFSDGNERTHLYTTLGYAYELLPAREQRIYVEWYESRNTLAGAPYFNPRRDRSIGLVQRSDFVFDTRFKRHVDHLSLIAGWYEQEGFGRHGRWGIKYEQDYDFNSANALSIGAGYYRNVYDGATEHEWRFDLNFRRAF
jgi:hypothetical protein